MTPERFGLVNDPVAPKGFHTNPDALDLCEEPASWNGQGDGLPQLLAFDDIFSQDSSIKQRLDEIVERVEANENTKATDFTVDADDHQRKFIDCPSETIRLLAPAGSGKTQSVVNRV
jgi:hypothetical protein